MATSAYLPSYQPYSTLTTSMNSFMGPSPSSSAVNGYGSSPLGYNMPLSQLRQQSSPTTLNQPESSSDRIRTLSDRSYERWKADAMFKDRVYSEFQDAVSDATSGLQRAPGTFQDYRQYMSNQGAPGLFGGSTAPIGQRLQGWNDQLFQNQSQYNQALQPVYSQFGMLSPQIMQAPVNTLQNPGW